MALADMTVRLLSTFFSDQGREVRLAVLDELVAHQPLVALEALKLVLELEKDGPLAPALGQVRATLGRSLGFKAAGLVADRAALAFRVPDSRYRFLKLLRAENGHRVYLAIHLGLRLPVEVCVLDRNAGTPDSAWTFLEAGRRRALATPPPVTRVIDGGTFAGWAYLASEPERPGAAGEIAPARPGLNARVLVIDDDLTVLLIASKILAGAGFQFQQAALPGEGLKLLGAGAFDVILTDLNFPGDLCGADVVTALKQVAATTPIVAMSSSEELDTWTEVLRQGVAGIVSKPLDATEMVAMIGRAASGLRPGILLVDESHLTRLVFRRFFENRGFVVTEAYGLASAKEQLRTSPPDVVVTEFQLPDGHGLEVAQHVLQSRREIKIVIHAADPTPGDVIRALRLRVGDVVTKTGSPRYLLNTIERMLATPGR